ncbi:hypothetical protein ABFX02_12G157900 [Erythranthe guttata]
MIEEFIFRSLILALGYAYPAFQCFKTLEKNKVGIQELRFWCQYWIIVAALTVVENFTDIFISWLPMYRGIKLALFIYLWHPNTKGSGYVYETLLQPYISRHETDIDRSVAEFKERAWNFAIDYWHNCTDLSSQKALQLFKFVVSHCTKVTLPSSQNDGNEQLNSAPPPTPPSTPSGIFKRTKSDKRRPPVPPSPSHRSQTPKSDSTKVQLRSQTQFIHTEDILIPDSNIGIKLEAKSDSEPDSHAKRVEHRPSKSN